MVNVREAIARLVMRKLAGSRASVVDILDANMGRHSAMTLRTANNASIIIYDDTTFVQSEGNEIRTLSFTNSDPQLSEGIINAALR